MKKMLGRFLIGLLAVNASLSLSNASQDRESDRNNTFAINVYKQLKSQQGNLFFSPFSVRTALAMAYAGAKENTAVEMAMTLGFQGQSLTTHSAIRDSIKAAMNTQDQEGFRIHIANSLWGQRGYHFIDSFLKLNKTYYAAKLQELDFAKEPIARKTINEWVEKETEGKIQNLISQGVLSELTRLVLTNAIYFKAKWQEPFNTYATNSADFHISRHQKVSVPTMFREGNYGYADLKSFQILEMPYQGSSTAMVIILPKASNTLEKAEGELNWESLNTWLSRLNRQEVRLYLPKFKVTSEFSLGDTLKKLGMVDAFSAKSADFSAMTGNKGIYLSAVLHKAFAAVDEDGTEAAAATAVVAALGAAPMERKEPPTFRADRPFLYLIRNVKDGSILFLGRVSNPKEST